MNDLNGIFGFVLYDSFENKFLISRDHIGIIPLYVGWDKKNTMYVSSELKALEGKCQRIEIFPPGSLYHSDDKNYVKWYNKPWMNFDTVKNNETRTVSYTHLTLPTNLSV